jgi:hypothetical protein
VSADLAPIVSEAGCEASRQLLAGCPELRLAQQLHHRLHNEEAGLPDEAVLQVGRRQTEADKMKEPVSRTKRFCRWQKTDRGRQNEGAGLPDEAVLQVGRRQTEADKMKEPVSRTKRFLLTL